MIGDFKNDAALVNPADALRDLLRRIESCDLKVTKMFIIYEHAKTEEDYRLNYQCAGTASRYETIGFINTALHAYTTDSVGG